MCFKLIAHYYNKGSSDPFIDEESYNIKAWDVTAHLINHFDRGAVTVTVLPMERTV